MVSNTKGERLVSVFFGGAPILASTLEVVSWPPVQPPDTDSHRTLPELPDLAGSFRSPVEDRPFTSFHTGLRGRPL